MTESRFAVAGASPASLQNELMRFTQHASIEITPDDAPFLPQLAALLRAGTTVYVAHTPKLGLEDVVRFAVRVQQAGFKASAHIVARALKSEAGLRDALMQLGQAGCGRILLVAEDYAMPAGPYASTIEVLESGARCRQGSRRWQWRAIPRGIP